MIARINDVQLSALWSLRMSYHYGNAEDRKAIRQAISERIHVLRIAQMQATITKYY